MNILGKIDHFLNNKDIPNSYIPLDGRTVSSKRYKQLWRAIRFNPRKYPGFETNEFYIKVPDWTGYYLKQDYNNLGEKNIDTMRGSSYSLEGSFPISLPMSTDAYDYYSGSFLDSNIGKKETLESKIEKNIIIEPSGTIDFSDYNPSGNILTTKNSFMINDPIFGKNKISQMLDAEQFTTKGNINIKKVQFNANISNENEHIGDLVEPQNIGIIFAICGRRTTHMSGVLYPDGSAKMYPDYTLPITYEPCPDKVRHYSGTLYPDGSAKRYMDKTIPIVYDPNEKQLI